MTTRKKLTPLEKEFKAVAKAAQKEINAQLKIAEKAIATAEKISEKNGIPFHSSVSPLWNTYYPTTMSKKWNVADEWDCCDDDDGDYIDSFGHCNDESCQKCYAHFDDNNVYIDPGENPECVVATRRKQKAEEKKDALTWDFVESLCNVGSPEWGEASGWEHSDVC